MTDIVLIYPKTGMDFGATVAPPHALLSIAAPLHKKGYRIKIIDQRVNSLWEQELGSVLKNKPICVGISAMTGSQIYFALKAAKIVRSKTNARVPIVWGGPHPSILPEQTLEDEHVDIVCVGEGDIAFSEIVEALERKRHLSQVLGIAYKDGKQKLHTRERPLLDVETLLPVPWELINVEEYIHPDFYLKKAQRSLDIGQTSRGCPFLCGFCSSANIRKRRWRAMSVDRSLQAIIEPIRRFNLDGIWIRDDEFYIDRERVSRICEGLIREGLKISWYTSGTRVDVFNKSTDNDISLLKRSGAYVLKFGAESGSDRILKLINKGITREDTIIANQRIKRHGIIPAFALMVGFPTETFEDINQTIDLAKRLIRDNPQAHTETIATYTALPGTPLYDLAIKLGLRPPQTFSDWSKWNFDEYDIEGKKIPWFSFMDRVRIGNISYISILSNAILNAIGGLKNRDLKRIMLITFKPIARFYRFRLWHRFYTFPLDLMFIRFLRDKVFYKSFIRIK